MSAPKIAVQQQTLELSDPNPVPEQFANSLAGIQVRDGLCHLTFGIVRPKHSGTGSSTNEHIVSARLIMPFSVLDGISKMTGDLQKAMAMTAMLGTPQNGVVN